MSSSFRNVAAFVPAPPLYYCEETTVEYGFDTGSVTVTAANSPSPSYFRSQPLKPKQIYATATTSPTKFQSSLQKAAANHNLPMKELTPCSPPTRKVSSTTSTLDPTSPSFKQQQQSTPPLTPHQWKKTPNTPSSIATAATALMMTPSSTSTSSLSSTAAAYLYTPTLSNKQLQQQSNAMAVDMEVGTILSSTSPRSPRYPHYHSIGHPSPSMPYHVPEYHPSPAVSPKSPTKGSHSSYESPKKKTASKYGSPIKRSPNLNSKKKNAYTVSSSSNNNNSAQPDDAVGSRKQRIKTELCMHYVQNKVCPFGDNCTYAHGEAELQTKTLADLQRSCLLDDVENYRTKPCFTFVAMGSCPFGRRCNAIHDPRVAGDLSSWLPLTETQGNNIATDINVEGLYQKRHYDIIAGNPFGEQFSIELDGWNDLYKLVTNTTAAQKRRKNTISEVHKLSIAIQMRGTHEWMYKYRPQHVIFQDTCMVLQKRAFSLENDSGNAIPISMKYYKSGNANHVLVHELAFGPDSDPSVRGVALWFNIPESQIDEVALQQAKRFRWKKTSKFDDSKTKKTSVFDTRECFTMIRPTDQDAFELASSILEHRYETVKAERLSLMEQRFESLKQLKSQKEVLEEMFRRQKNSWITWAYPINNGRQRNDADTPIPPVDDEYHPIIDADMLDLQTQPSRFDESATAVSGAAVEGIWRSFVSFLPQESASHPVVEDDQMLAEGMAGRFCSRLSVFVRLSRGEPVSPNRALPHITRSYNTKKVKRDIENLKTTSQFSLQSERCWKSMLLKNDQPMNQPSEWHIVMDHFQNFSRSQKVLSILQQ